MQSHLQYRLLVSAWAASVRPRPLSSPGSGHNTTIRPGRASSGHGRKPAHTGAVLGVSMLAELGSGQGKEGRAAEVCVRMSGASRELAESRALNWPGPLLPPGDKGAVSNIRQPSTSFRRVRRGWASARLCRPHTCGPHRSLGIFCEANEARRRGEANGVPVCVWGGGGCGRESERFRASDRLPSSRPERGSSSEQSAWTSGVGARGTLLSGSLPGGRHG